MIAPPPALVRPRVFSASGAVLLEDLVAVRLEAEQWGTLWLSGPAGSGKSTALEYLRQRFADEPRLQLVDLAVTQVLPSEPGERTNQLIILACRQPPHDRCAVHWRMAPWLQDDWIEYLLALHPDECGHVIQRLKQATDRHWLQGLAVLWHMVLDRMAAYETITSVRSALRTELYERLKQPGSLVAMREVCHQLLLNPSETSSVARISQDAGRPIPDDMAQLQAIPAVQILLGAEYLAEDLARRRNRKLLQRGYATMVIEEIARLLAADPLTLEWLQQLLKGRDSTLHATAASVLHAAQVDLQPLLHHGVNLTDAVLPNSHWPGLQLRRLGISGADLSASNLRGAAINYLQAGQANLQDICLRELQSDWIVASGARLAGADLAQLRATWAYFTETDLTGADLTAAHMVSADFRRANLSGACLREARLSRGQFSHARLDGADFTKANLAGAEFEGTDLSGAILDGAQLMDAVLRGSNLEGLRIANLQAERANFTEATLTGSELTSACLRKAVFRHARLAEINWEGADLREADLRECTFHLGSSRSGLVDSPIACEGSRTGFYTDEYEEQGFKSPEEIRKANLCGADLRGALIEGTDFYLVDLRGARYSSVQADHFRACRAIL